MTSENDMTASLASSLKNKTRLAVLYILHTRGLISDRKIHIVWWSALAISYPETATTIPLPDTLPPVQFLIPDETSALSTDITPWLEVVIRKYSLNAIVSSEYQFHKHIYFFLKVVDGQEYQNNSFLMADEMPMAMMTQRDIYNWWTYHFHNFRNGPVRGDWILGFPMSTLETVKEQRTQRLARREKGCTIC